MGLPGVAADLSPYVPRLVVEWLADDPGAEWREVDGTMVFVDISGFTAMSERLAGEGKAGAEQVTEVMNATFEALLEIINVTELAGVWGEDEAIGWVYQFFNSKEERAAMRDPKQGGSQAPRNSRELAVQRGAELE